MIKQSWKMGQLSIYKAYELKIYNRDMNRTILEQRYGNLTGQAILGDAPIAFASDTIKFELTIYY